MQKKVITTLQKVVGSNRNTAMPIPSQNRHNPNNRFIAPPMITSLYHCMSFFRNSCSKRRSFLAFSSWDHMIRFSALSSVSERYQSKHYSAFSSAGLSWLMAESNTSSGISTSTTGSFFFFPSFSIISGIISRILLVAF